MAGPADRRRSGTALSWLRPSGHDTPPQGGEKYPLRSAQRKFFDIVFRQPMPSAAGFFCINGERWSGGGVKPIFATLGQGDSDRLF